MKTNVLEVIFIFTLTYIPRNVAYDLPEIKLKALYPSGIKVTMQDNGFSSFTFYGNLVRGRATKQIHFYLPSATKGYWTIMDKDMDLFKGEVMAYRVIVALKNGSQLQKVGNWVVNEFVTEEECVISATELPCNRKVCENTLIFNEDFNSFDASVWKIETMFPQGPDYPFNAYTVSAVIMANGSLVIKPILKETVNQNEKSWNLGSECTGEAGTRECIQTASGAHILPPVISGKISTQKSFNFKYGRIEVRAKLPAGSWLIPEINLEPLNYKYGRLDYGSGLVRIAYVRGNENLSRNLYGGPIVCPDEPCRSSLLKNFTNFNYKWDVYIHNFTLIWKPTGFQFLVDGVSYGEFNPRDDIPNEDVVNNVPHADAWESGGRLAPFDDMFYIALGVRVGGINDFPDQPGKPWDNKNNKALYKFWQDKQNWYPTWSFTELIVDHVRVYAL